jgi:hypothetical protein
VSGRRWAEDGGRKAAIRLHLYRVHGGWLVENIDDYRLLAGFESGPVVWGFTENSDEAHVFASKDEALAVGRMWDAGMTDEEGR